MYKVFDCICCGVGHDELTMYKVFDSVCCGGGHDELTMYKVFDSVYCGGGHDELTMYKVFDSVELARCVVVEIVHVKFVSSATIMVLCGLTILLLVIPISHYLG